MESEVNKRLLFAHFARKTSPLQRERIAQWLRADTNEEKYYAWLEEWESIHPQYEAQTESALERYVAFLNTNPHSEDPDEGPQVTPDPGPWRGRQWAVAASILLLLCVGALPFHDPILYRTYATTFGETRTLRLSDGSQVVLNANSSLRVPRWGFGDKTREVLLAGEASFSVMHTPSHQPFKVKTARNLEVVVLGTEFTVFARKRGARVVLRKGQVRVQYHQGTANRQVVMKPGELMTLDGKKGVALKKIEHPPLQPSWSEKRFVFDETPLREVAYLLEENYGLQVEIKDPELAERVLMGSFRADNVDQLLQSLSELLDIDVVRQGNRVQLTSR